MSKEDDDISLSVEKQNTKQENEGFTSAETGLEMTSDRAEFEVR